MMKHAQVVFNCAPYTLSRYPTREQLTSVAQKIVTEYGFLKDKSIGTGYVSTICFITGYWESPPACCQEIFLISQEIFKEKQDIKNEAREISKISIKVTNITISIGNHTGRSAIND
jgi:hypothetical protein